MAESGTSDETTSQSSSATNTAPIIITKDNIRKLFG